jgi:Fe-S-cluster containining protein
METGELATAVIEASTRAAVHTAVADLYESVGREIARRKPACVLSGKCCHFDEYGHRLYVTTLELAKFFHDYQTRPRASISPSRSTEGEGRGKGSVGVPTRSAEPKMHPHPIPLPEYMERGPENAGKSCPLQSARLCTVHTIRPMGCRLFFCDSSSNDWQHDQYEKFHADLKRLHESLAVPYFYVEWRAALSQLGFT